MQIIKKDIFLGSKEYYDNLDELGISFILDNEGIRVEKKGDTDSIRFISLYRTCANKTEYFPKLGLYIGIFYSKYMPEPTLNGKESFEKIKDELLQYLSSL